MMPFWSCFEMEEEGTGCYEHLGLLFMETKIEDRSDKKSQKQHRVKCALACFVSFLSDDIRFRFCY